MILTDPSGTTRTCTIYSAGLSITTNGAMIIPGGTPNVILYCICRRNNVAVGPTTWQYNGTAVPTTASGDNPYTRDNVPSPLIIPLFTATHAGTYGCASVSTTSSVTIDLILSGIAI